ncbi:MAG TPA: phenylalanine--tRNA ligase beta subunit-related protein [Thermoleophilaceae bacterium]|nr:phenylalanine--tRNA ligase beta subunit-related protein [Thermoleophilaceae bacterium]
MIDDPELTHGYVDATLRAEFPDLGLVYTEVPVRPRRSPPEVRERLRTASDRFTGAKAVTLRQQPIPWAYRVFFRHVGIDPDERRTPIEAIALERMRAGGFLSRNVVDDALLLATLETGVPVLAFDAAAVDGELGLRVSPGGESLGELPLSSGQVVVADGVRALAVLFGETAEGCGVQPSSQRMLLAGVRVKGVPEVSIEEALWVAAETVSDAD